MHRVRVVILIYLFALVTAIKEDKKYWLEIAEEELKESLSLAWNTNVAKNVILFVGDGMSPDTIAASRIHRDDVNSYLAWEKFPHVGLLKTYNVDKLSPDSASTATALFTGVKTNYRVHGVDGNVAYNDCEASQHTDNRLESILSWAQAVGKSTGFVTTTRVTHATPAPLYSYGPNRKWECETSIPKNITKCKDIARQLIENEPGKSIKVIMGGGRQMLQTNITRKENDPIDTWSGRREDGRDLINEWVEDKKSRNVSFSVVQNTKELENIDCSKTEFVLGIFANGHFPMDFKRDKTDDGQPSLEQMTVAALKILRKSEEGYLLVVEGGLIDFAHHRGHAAQALLETIRFSDAINTTLQMVDLENTLVIVTSDHAHSFTFNGNTDRGSSILGIAEMSRKDETPYTATSYGTGGPNNAAYLVINNTAVRMDPRKSNTSAFDYSQQALFIADEARHGAGDVAVYANGPYAHLFHTTHEQNFVAYVIAYAAKIGPYANSSSSAKNQWSLARMYSMLAIIQILHAIVSHCRQM